MSKTGDGQKNKLMRYPDRPGRLMPDRDELKKRESDLRRSGLNAAANAVRRELDRTQK